MKGLHYKSMCRALVKGEDRFVENLENHHVGEALACFGDMVEIDIFGKRETWARENCREVPPPDFDYHH